jgi:Fe-S oxidoreductase
MFLTEKEREETIWACRFCMMCHVADRVGQVVRRESYTPRGRGAIIYAVEKGLLNADEGVADIMYTTLNDRLIREWCVGHYDHEELVIDERARLFGRGQAPTGVVRFCETLRNNPVRGQNPETILRQAGVTIRAGAEVLLFCGHSAREFRPDTLVAAGRIFNAAGVAFSVLPEEPTSGWALYQLGDFEGARAVSRRLAEAIVASGARSVVALDADAYRMLMGRTGRFGGDLKGLPVEHILRTAAEWLRSGKLRVKAKLDYEATYHDPCVLARDFEDLGSPRFILQSILRRPIAEMATSGKLANCCGAGGMLAVHRPDVSEKVAGMRLEEARETGAAILVTGCPRCDVTLEGAVASGACPRLRVANLVDLLAEAVCG